VPSAAPDPVADVPAEQVVQPAAVSYVPAPVAFVSGEEDAGDYPPASGSSRGYGAGEADGALGSSGGGGARPHETARTAPEKVFDVSAPRRRPVVFEEDDDLDVPDFLK
jgi:cell division protein FtsZ